MPVAPSRGASLALAAHCIPAWLRGTRVLRRGLAAWDALDRRCCLGDSGAQGVGMQPKTPNEAYWLKRARQAREHADKLTHPQARRLMMEIAAGYQRLAQYRAE